MAGTLYLIGTPIGNLEDITLRALRILQEVDAVFSEDPRVPRKLLTHHDTRKPLFPLFQHSGVKAFERALQMLADGRVLAYVTCAGTPAVSDPGPQLVACVRERFGDEAAIISLPGPSAVTAIAALSAVPMDEFHFFGYPPAKKGRKSYFEDVATNPYPGILFESPHRIRRTMGDLVAAIGEDRRAIVGRELTKVFETIRRGKMGELRDAIAAEKPRGEYVILVEPPVRKA